MSNMAEGRISREFRSPPSGQQNIGMKIRSIKGWGLAGLLLLAAQTSFGQIDPYHRNLLELGYDQPLEGRGPQAAYLYYYYNNPEIIGTNTAFRVAVAPAYLDGEFGFKNLLSPTTSVGVGVYGGAFSDNYYQINQGQYYQTESFDGYGAGTSLSLYQRVNPGMLVPLNAMARGGLRYTTYEKTDKTADDFQLPEDRVTTFVRAGLRLGGKEPVLYPDLSMELSVWFMRQWRSDANPYGFNGDEDISSTTDLYWLYAGLNYAWTNIGHQVSFAATVGGSANADRFSAWRLGGVLPLVAEFPLVLPGYYYQELSATRVVHLYGSYVIPLDRAHRFQFRMEAASAYLDYLSGFEQPTRWQTGAGCGLMFTPKSQLCRIVLRYGYGFNALRNHKEGANSVGLLFEYDFEKRLEKKRATE